MQQGRMGMTTLACRPRILTALAIAVSLGLLVLSDGASAEDKKVSGTAKFGPTLSQTMLLPGDAPKHEVMLVNRISSGTAPIRIGIMLRSLNSLIPTTRPARDITAATMSMPILAVTEPF